MAKINIKTYHGKNLAFHLGLAKVLDNQQCIICVMSSIDDLKRLISRFCPAPERSQPFP